MDDVHIKNAVIMNSLQKPIRLQVLDMLSCGEFCASAIQEYFSISQPTISCHMKILASAGVVLVRKEGQFILFLGTRKGKRFSSGDREHGCEKRIVIAERLFRSHVKDQNNYETRRLRNDKICLYVIVSECFNSVLRLRKKTETIKFKKQ